MATIAELTGFKRTKQRTRPVSKDRAFHFRRVQAGYYISNRPHRCGEHIVIEQHESGRFWMLRFEESGLISTHGSVKACKFALEEV